MMENRLVLTESQETAKQWKQGLRSLGDWTALNPAYQCTMSLEHSYPNTHKYMHPDTHAHTSRAHRETQQQNDWERRHPYTVGSHSLKINLDLRNTTS